MVSQILHVKRSYIFRLFIPIVLISALIVIIASGLLIHNLYRNIEDYIISNHRITLLQESNSIKNQIETAHTIASYLINDPDILQAEAQPEKIIQHKQIIPAKLIRYMIASPAIDEIYLYIGKTGYIFSGTGLYPDNYSVTTILAETVYFHDFLKNPDNFFKFRYVRLSRPNDTVRSRILYTISYSTSITVCISFDNRLLSQQANLVNGSSNRDVILLMVDDEQTVLGSNFGFAEQQFSQSDFDHPYFSHNGNHYLIIREPVKDTPISLIMGIPEQIFREQERLVSLYGTISASLILLLVIFLSYLIAKYNYKPIGALYESVVGVKAKKVNEFQSIDTTIRHIRDENARIIGSLIASQRSIKNGLLSSLVNGKYQNVDELNREASLINKKFQGSTFWIVVLIADSLLQDTADLPDPFPYYSSGELATFGAQLYNENEMIYFVASDHVQSEIMFSDELLQMACGRIKSSFAIGVSNRQAEICTMGQALDEARHAAESRQDEAHAIAFYRDLPLVRDTVQDIWQLEIMIGHIQTALLKGDDTRLVEMLAELETFISDNAHSAALLRSACNRLSNLAMYAYGNYIDYFNTYDHTFDLTCFNNNQSLQGLMAVVKRLGQHIKDILFSIEVVKNKEYVERIKQYILDHCFAYDFSVQAVADHFEISSSSLSKIFHQITNKTIIAHVTMLRLEKAKNLLVNSSLMISDIVREVGYLSETTFSNTYKKYTGVSPNKYRKLHSIRK